MSPLKPLPEAARSAGGLGENLYERSRNDYQAGSRAATMRGMIFNKAAAGQMGILSLDYSLIGLGS